MNDLEIIKQLCDVDVPYNEVCSIEANALGEIQEAATRMANRIAELEQASCETCKSFQEATPAEIVEGNYWCDCRKMYWGMTDHFHKEKMKCSEWEAL